MPYMAKKKTKKLDLKGKSSGGSEHKSKKRPSTKGKHQKGHAAKRQSYGGEKADDGRRYPRRRPKGWTGPWPLPEESETPPDTGDEREELTSGAGEDVGHEGEGEMTGQQLYAMAERLAREADRNGGPLPVALLQEAASTGYPPALYALANWHLHGKGVRKDYKKAFSLLKKAANERFAPAEHDLAVAYELGKGVEKSEKQAWLYYLQAAHDGDRDAMTEVARCFYHGIGTKKDFAKAAEWYRRAAERGDSDAQYALGVAYEQGEGVEKSIHTSMQWYKKAAEQGDEEAEQALVELQQRGQ
jgi:TPR repeat protein